MHFTRIEVQNLPGLIFKPFQMPGANFQPHHLKIILPLMVFFIQGCYSVRIGNKFGTATPDPTNNEPGFYRQKEVVIIDTVVNIGLLDNGVMTLERCPMGCFHSVEYRATLGGVLLNFITFGKKKLIKVKYVCLKDSNE
jgi:hypothetical protein